MKFYKDENEKVYGYTYAQAARGQVPSGLTEITEAEKDVLTAPPPQPDPVSATQRKVVDVLKQSGAWADYRAYIHADQDRFDAFYLSQEIRIDDPFIQDAIADPAFPLTQEEAQQIINAANGV